MRHSLLKPFDAVSHSVPRRKQGVQGRDSNMNHPCTGNRSAKYTDVWGSNLKFVYSIYGMYWNARDGCTVEQKYSRLEFVADLYCEMFRDPIWNAGEFTCYRIPKISGTSLVSSLWKSSKVRASSILTTWSLSLLLAFYCGRVTRFNKFSQPGPLRLDHLIYPLPPSFSMLGAILILNHDISWFIF